MPSLAAQLTNAVPDDYAHIEAAWQIITLKGWPASPELVFALVALAHECEAEQKSSLEIIGNGRTT